MISCIRSVYVIYCADGVFGPELLLAYVVGHIFISSIGRIALACTSILLSCVNRRLGDCWSSDRINNCVIVPIYGNCDRVSISTSQLFSLLFDGIGMCALSLLLISFFATDFVASLLPSDYKLAVLPAGFQVAIRPNLYGSRKNLIN